MSGGTGRERRGFLCHVFWVLKALFAYRTAALAYRHVTWLCAAPVSLSVTGPTLTGGYRG